MGRFKSSARAARSKCVFCSAFSLMERALSVLARVRFVLDVSLFNDRTLLYLRFYWSVASSKFGISRHMLGIASLHFSRILKHRPTVSPALSCVLVANTSSTFALSLTVNNHVV